MTSKYVIWIVLGTCLWSTPAAMAQPDDNEEQEVKQQIEALRQQLLSMEKSKVRSPRTTQLGPARRRDREPLTVTKLYDLSDLFAVVPNYPARAGEDLQDSAVRLFPGLNPGSPNSSDDTGATRGMGGMGGGGGGSFDVEEHRLPRAGQNFLGQADGSDIAARTSIADFIKFLTTAVKPADGWDDEGGQGTIARIGYLLLVTTDEDSQTQIEAVLNLLRGRWGTLRTVTIEAWWLPLGSDELAIIDQSAPADRGAAHVRSLPDETWKVLLAATGQEQSYHTVLSCYNGQTVHALSGDESLVVADLRSVSSVAEEEGGGLTNAPSVYEPVVRVLQEGLALEVTPAANRSGKIVVLDLHSRICQRHDAKAKTAQRGNRTVISPREMVDALDRPIVSTHRLSTTLRVPVGPVVQVGGMSTVGSGQGGKPGLYLFVRLNVQEIRDDLNQSEDADAPRNPQPAISEQGIQDSTNSADPPEAQQEGSEPVGVGPRRDESGSEEPEDDDPETPPEE